MSDIASSKPASPDGRYYAEGVQWERDIYAKVRRSRALAWTVAAVFGAISLGLVAALLMMIPLQKFEAYAVLVDKTTGYTEVVNAVDDARKLPNTEAVTMSNVVRFLKARETYDPKAVKENFELASLLSTGDAARELAELYNTLNPNNPVALYGRNVRISVNIKSVTFPNEQTALVRFSTLQDDRAEITTRHWVSVVRFRYTTSPMKNEWRFDNPLGFQVTEYRRDQESVRPDVKEKTQ